MSHCQQLEVYLQASVDRLSSCSAPSPPSHSSCLQPPYSKKPSCLISMCASHGKAQHGGVLWLASSLSSTAVPPVVSPVVPSGESVNPSTGVRFSQVSDTINNTVPLRTFNASSLLFIDVFHSSSLTANHFLST